MDIVVHEALAARRAILEAPPADRLTICRERLLEPMRPSWGPMLAHMPAAEGTDPESARAQAAVRMVGLFSLEAAPTENLAAVDRLIAAGAEETLRATLGRSARAFTDAGATLPIDRVGASIVVGDAQNQYFMDMAQGYSGFGGIPGYVIVTIWPNDFTLPRLGPAAAHEFHRNVRLSHEPFSMNISLAEYIVMEGLAESFAGALFRKELVGPWVTRLSPEEQALSREVIGKALTVTGFNNVRPYVFGNPAASFGFAPVGVPFAAGYNIGYQIVQAYLRRTGRTIVEATSTPSSEIVAESGFFEG